MTPTLRTAVTVLALSLILIGLISCAGNQGPVVPDSEAEPFDLFAHAASFEQDRHVLGMWRMNLEAGTCEPVSTRTLQDHMNVADELLMPEYALAFAVTFDPFISSGAFAPPALKINATLRNVFDIDGWNVRGIVIDDTGLIEVLDPDGWTAQWDIGGNIPLNPYMLYADEDGCFEDMAIIEREYTIECPSGVLPTEVWFAVDVGLEGLIQSATEFPIAAVNGTLRWPGDQAPIVCSIMDPLEVVKWVGAATKDIAGHPTFLTLDSVIDGYSCYTGTLDYSGSVLGAQNFYLGAISDLDIPTLAVATAYIDPGPFATGPLEGVCSQRCYDPARTCRAKWQIAQPLTDFEVKAPPSASGLVIVDNNLVVRRLDDDRSIALQSPGLNVPAWTRLIGETGLPSSPAIGNDGTIFFLEPEQGRLRALFEDGTDRWSYQFETGTHIDLVLTSSPLGGLLLTVLRKDGCDTAIVAVGTDGHFKWQFDLVSAPPGVPDEPRLAVGPLGTVYYTLPTGGVFALDLMGNPKWAFSKAGWLKSQDPVVGDDDRLFFSVNGGTLLACVSASGSEIWVQPVDPGTYAKFPSLDYDGNLFTVIGQNNDYIGMVARNEDTGAVLLQVPAEGARGYVVHGTNGDFTYVQREHPDPPQPTGGDDFFVSRSSNGGLNWWLHTPGVTQIGAYPVVDPNSAIYVQGPDGMYVVTF